MTENGLSCLKSFWQLWVERFLISFFVVVVELTTVFWFEDLFSSMKAKSLEPKPIHKDNETHQSTGNFTGTHKTASTQSQSSLCLFTPRVADCFWILPRIQNRVFLKLMSLAYSSDMVLCKQCQMSHVFHTSPRQSRQLTSFPPSAQAFADILFPSDTPIDYLLVTSTSQHKASYGMVAATTEEVVPCVLVRTTSSGSPHGFTHCCTSPI